MKSILRVIRNRIKRIAVPVRIVPAQPKAVSLSISTVSTEVDSESLRASIESRIRSTELR